MGKLPILLAAALAAAAFAAPATAAGFSGGAGGPGASGPGGAGSNGGGMVIPGGGPGSAGPGNGAGSPGGAGASGPRGPAGPSHGLGGAFQPSVNPGGANSGFKPPHIHLPPTGTPAPGVVGHGPGIDWRHRPRHYWFGGGPVFVPDPSGDYVYGQDDYDDGSDATGCWVYRKAFDRAGRFLGWVRVDVCEGQ